MRYRHLPVEVAAFQWAGTLMGVPEWFDEALRGKRIALLNGVAFINTPEGVLPAFVGYWVINDGGIIAPCNPSVFAQHYAAIEDAIGDAEPVYGTERSAILQYNLPLNRGFTHYERQTVFVQPTWTPTVLRGEVENWLAARYGPGVYVVTIDTDSDPAWFVSVRFVQDDSAANENSAPGVG